MDNNLPTDWLEQLKSVYPRRSGGQGWMALPRLIQKALASGATWSALLAGAQSYASYCRREGLIGTGFVKQARTFFGPDGWWAESYEPEARPKLPQELALERRWEALLKRAQESRFRRPIPNIESADVYETALRTHETRVVPLRRVG